MPDWLLGASIKLMSLQVCPPSADHVVAMRPGVWSKPLRCALVGRVRAKACSLPSGCTSIVGWMQRHESVARGAVFVHSPVFMLYNSKCIFHPPASVDDGHTRLSPTIRGLFLIGPRNPSGNGSRSPHVRPPSRDLHTQPAQSGILFPILKNSHTSPSGISNNTGFQHAFLRYVESTEVVLRLAASQSIPNSLHGPTAALTAVLSSPPTPAKRAYLSLTENTPSAASTGLSHSVVLLCVYTHTSGLRSFVPPK